VIFFTRTHCAAIAAILTEMREARGWTQREAAEEWRFERELKARS
jgi:hypothetical protein